MRNRNLVIVLMAIVVAGMMFTGCGGNDTIVSQMTGTWNSAKDGAAIKINLSGEKKIIEIGGKAIPVTIKKINESAYIVRVDVQLENGKTSEWTFRQVWSENGSSFTIKFDHNGEVETLTHA